MTGDSYSYPCSIKKRCTRNRRGAFLEILRGSNPRPPRAKRDKDGITLILLSNVDGVYNGNPKDSHTRIIPSVYYDRDISEYISTDKSSMGRGGMESKVKTAHEVANAGIKVIIANGNTPNILVNLTEHPLQTFHTEFVARPKGK